MFAAYPLIPVLHALSTWFMVGLIWFVQIVHYPLFAAVGEEGFRDYEQRHTLWTGYVVMPPMLVEAAATALLLAQRPTNTWTLTGAALLAVVWASTFFVQVPCHARLAEGFDPAVAERLVRTNWIRTVAWSARGVVALVLLREALVAAAAARPS